MMDLEALFAALWQDYSTLNPAAARIFKLLEERGETVVNDHIALRTFAHPLICASQLARPFEKFGYVRAGGYVFINKHLRAWHWQHPDATKPKIFISELELARFSSGFHQLITQLIEQVPSQLPRRDDFAVAGRPWNLSRQDYLRLAAESEYAGWLAAYGFRANHFTVSVNHLKTFGSLTELNAFLKNKGYRFNASGGEIKGSPADGLEQSSTQAEEATVEFSDGSLRVPSVYYEFARRYPQADGQLYQGFVTASADRIFESTNRTSEAPLAAT